MKKTMIFVSLFAMVAVAALVFAKVSHRKKAWADLVAAAEKSKAEMKLEYDVRADLLMKVFADSPEIVADLAALKKMELSSQTDFLNFDQALNRLNTRTDARITAFSAKTKEKSSPNFRDLEAIEHRIEIARAAYHRSALEANRLAEGWEMKLVHLQTYPLFEAERQMAGLQSAHSR